MRLVTDRLLLSVVGLVAVTAIGVVYLFAEVLQVPLTHRPPQVEVHLERTGGLFEGSPVTYRGVRVGTVRELDIERGGVLADVELHDDVEVPRDTRAQVRSLSPVGEQFLDLQPDHRDGPYLADGDVIEASATDVPVAVASASEEVIGLIDAIDRGDLRVVMREASIALDGSGGDLESLLTSTDRLTTSLDRAWPQTASLLRNGERAGRVIERHNDDLLRLSASSQRLARFLRDYDPRFRRVLTHSARDLDTIGGLMDDLKVVLPPLLRQLFRLTDLAYEREPHLRALPEALVYGASRFASVFHDGALNLFVNLQGSRRCEYGVGQRDPASTDRKPLATGGHCTLDDDVWRGAEHAPPPLAR